MYMQFVYRRRRATGWMARDVSMRERIVFVVGCSGTNAMGEVFEVGAMKSMTLRMISRGRDSLSWLADMLWCCRGLVEIERLLGVRLTEGPLKFKAASTNNLSSRPPPSCLRHSLHSLAPNRFDDVASVKSYQNRWGRQRLLLERPFCLFVSEMRIIKQRCSLARVRTFYSHRGAVEIPNLIGMHWIPKSQSDSMRPLH